jgi:hypothetical protein
MNGNWYENCTLYPRDRYWCPTQVDPITRVQLSKARIIKGFGLDIRMG